MLRFIVLRGLALALVVLAVTLFWWPAGVLIHAAFDRGVSAEGVPAVAWPLHRSLAPRMEKWASERLVSSAAAQAHPADVAATEWPVFGSAFYLMAMENLQAAWDQNHGPSVAPREFAREAIEATGRLVADPNQAEWVRRQWGDDYLKKENLFYRMVLIASFTAHERLLGTGQYLTVLREQVESLSAELDAAPSGLLRDYPEECYHTDVLFAIRAIRHADSVLGTDHSAFVERELRAFPPGKMPPSRADAPTGEALARPRGCASSAFILHASSLWPAHVPEWQRLYNSDSWQSVWWAAGYREHPRSESNDGPLPVSSFADIDSGPIVAGFGAAASAFAVGSTRAAGDASRARVLALEALAVSWPLPSGGLLVPRLVSDQINAPCIGENILLWAMTQPPKLPLQSDPEIKIPGLVWIVGGGQFVVGGLLLLLARHWWRKAR